MVRSASTARPANSAKCKESGETGRHQVPPPRARASRSDVTPAKSARVSGDKKVIQMFLPSGQNLPGRKGVGAGIEEEEPALQQTHKETKKRQPGHSAAAQLEAFGA